MVKHVNWVKGTCQHPNPDAGLTERGEGLSNVFLQLVLHPCCSKERQSLLQTKENLMRQKLNDIGHWE